MKVIQNCAFLSQLKQRDKETVFKMFNNIKVCLIRLLDLLEIINDVVHLYIFILEMSSSIEKCSAYSYSMFY